MDSKKHFYWLDWMRFIAAFMVVVCHSRGFNWVEWGALPNAEQTLLLKLFFAGTRAGLEWVVVFFVLSGFLVGGGVINRCLKGTFNLKSYSIDRVSRIWVPLIPALFLTLGVALYCGLPVSLLDLLGNIIALQGVFFKNFGHNEPLWSLSYEIWFYVIIGAVGVILSPRSKNHFFSLLILMIGFSVFTRLNTNFLCCWLLGAFSYFLVTESKKTGLIVVALLFVVLGSAISQVQADTLSITKYSLMTFLPSRNIAILIESSGIGLLIAAICRLAPMGVLLIKFERIGGALAAFSYTLYLTHYPILNLWEHFIPLRSPSFTASSFLIFLSKIFSCLLAAYIMYLPFEARTPQVREWIHKKFPNRS